MFSTRTQKADIKVVIMIIIVVFSFMFSPLMAQDVQQSLQVWISCEDGYLHCDGGIPIEVTFYNSGEKEVKFVDEFSPRYFGKFFWFQIFKEDRFVKRVTTGGNISFRKGTIKYITVLPNDFYQIKIDLGNVRHKGEIKRIDTGWYRMLVYYVNQYGTGFRGQVKSNKIVFHRTALPIESKFDDSEKRSYLKRLEYKSGAFNYIEMIDMIKKELPDKDKKFYLEMMEKVINKLRYEKLPRAIANRNEIVNKLLGMEGLPLYLKIKVVNLLECVGDDIVDSEKYWQVRDDLTKKWLAILEELESKKDASWKPEKKPNFIKTDKNEFVDDFNYTEQHRLHAYYPWFLQMTENYLIKTYSKSAKGLEHLELILKGSMINKSSKLKIIEAVKENIKKSNILPE